MDALETDTARKLLGPSGILQLTRPHEASDLTLTCRSAGRRSSQKAGGIVQLYCHYAVLGDRFGLIAGMQRFQESVRSSLTAPSSIDVPMDEDVVFEVLRFVYCGYVCVPAGFRNRFSELLRVVDFLGLQDAEAFFNEPSVRSLVRSMPDASLQSAMKDTSFDMRCAITQSLGIADRKPPLDDIGGASIKSPVKMGAYSSAMAANLAGVAARGLLLECVTSDGIETTTTVGRLLDTISSRCGDDVIDPLTHAEARSVIDSALTVSHEDGAIRIVWYDDQQLN